LINPPSPLSKGEISNYFAYILRKQTSPFEKGGEFARGWRGIFKIDNSMILYAYSLNEWQ
jgi:hypothetical protein